MKIAGKRDMNHKVMALLGCLTICWVEVYGARPNILFCIMDDASWVHMSAYGCEWVETPAFDRLAADGILFMNAYTPNAKCAPSRSSILTGRNSWQLEEAANHVVHFPAAFKTFPEVLREAGYVTGKTGKGGGRNPGMKNGKPELIGTSWAAHKEIPISRGFQEDYATNFVDFLDENEGREWLFWFGARDLIAVMNMGVV